MTTKRPRPRPIAPARQKGVTPSTPPLIPADENSTLTEGSSPEAVEPEAVEPEATNSGDLHVESASNSITPVDSNVSFVSPTSLAKDRKKRTFTLSHQVISQLIDLQSKCYRVTGRKPDLSDMVEDALMLYFAEVERGDGLPLGRHYRE